MTNSLSEMQLTIILSGSAVPGEGEHKAMDFIRRQRCQPGYQPLKHAFYGPVSLCDRKGEAAGH